MQYFSARGTNLQALSYHAYLITLEKEHFEKYDGLWGHVSSAEKIE